MAENRPRVKLDAFPVRARVTSKPEGIEALIDALALALSLPDGWTLRAGSMGWSARGAGSGPLEGGLLLVASKKDKRSSGETLVASHVAFDEEGRVVAWSGDLDVDVPSRALELDIRDASGARAMLPDACRERALALGLSETRARAKKAASAARIFVAEAPLWAVDLSPDGARCASTDQKSTLSLWDVMTGERVGRRSIASARAIVQGLAHSHDGARIVSGARPLNVVDAHTLATLLELEIPSGGEVRHVAWSPDDRFIAAAIGAARRANVVVWDARTGERVVSAEHGNPWRIAFTPSGDGVVVGGYGPTLQFARASGALVHRSEMPAPHSLVWLGRSWALGGDAGEVILLGADLGPEGTLPIAGLTRGPRIAVDRERRTLVAGSWTAREIAIVDLVSRTVRARASLPTVDDVTPSLQSVSISADGSTIAATAGWSVAIYDAEGGLRVVPRVG